MRYSYVFLAFLGALAACTGPVIMGSDAAVIAVTKPGSPPPADTQHQIPEHEEWCYQTMANPECYAHAQNVLPERLINVDPQNRYPVDADAYRQAVSSAKPVPAPAPAPVAEAPPAEAQPAAPAAATTVPAALEPASAVPVEKDMLKDEISATPPVNPGARTP